MAENTLIQKQHEIIQRSYRIMNEYERTKAEADARFKREKETAEAAGREISSAIVEEIRKIAKSTEDAINAAKLQSKVSGGIAGSPPPPATSEHELLLQVSQCQSVAEQTSKNISDILLKEMEKSRLSYDIRIIKSGVAFSISLLIILLMALLLPGITNGASITIVLIVMTNLIYFVISRLFRQKPLDSNIKKRLCYSHANDLY